MPYSYHQIRLKKNHLSTYFDISWLDRRIAFGIRLRPCNWCCQTRHQLYASSILYYSCSVFFFFLIYFNFFFFNILIFFSFLFADVCYDLKSASPVIFLFFLSPSHLFRIWSRSSTVSNCDERAIAEQHAVCVCVLPLFKSAHMSTRRGRMLVGLN